MADLNDDCLREILRWLRTRLVWKCAAVSRRWLRAAQLVLVGRGAVLEVSNLSLSDVSYYRWCPSLDLGGMSIRYGTLRGWPVRELYVHDPPPTCIPSTVTNLTVSGGISVNWKEWKEKVLPRLERFRCDRLYRVTSLFKLGSSYPNLKALHIRSTAFSADNFVHLPNLQQLEIERCTIECWPTTLRYLNIHRLQHADGLAGLRELHVRGECSAALLRELTNLEALQYLSPRREVLEINLPRLTSLTALTVPLLEEREKGSLRLKAPYLRKLSLLMKSSNCAFLGGILTCLRELHMTNTTTERMRLPPLDLRALRVLETVSFKDMEIERLDCHRLRSLELDVCAVLAALPPATRVVLDFCRDDDAPEGAATDNDDSDTVNRDGISDDQLAAIRWTEAPRLLCVRASLAIGGQLPEGVEALVLDCDLQANYRVPHSCRYLEAVSIPANLSELSHLEHCHIVGKEEAMRGLVASTVCVDENSCWFRWDD